MKPGYKTTEFWLSFAAVLVAAIIGSGLLDAIPGSVDNQIIAIIGSVLAALGYSASRVFAKASAEKGETLRFVAEEGTRVQQILNEKK